MASLIENDDISVQVLTMSYDADDHNGNGPITMPHVLELMGVSHNGPIVPKRPSVWSRITNKTPTGLILKDVSFEVSENCNQIVRKSWKCLKLTGAFI